MDGISYVQYHDAVSNVSEVIYGFSISPSISMKVLNVSLCALSWSFSGLAIHHKAHLSLMTHDPFL
jgi:hypothetical protein